MKVLKRGINPTLNENIIDDKPGITACLRRIKPNIKIASSMDKFVFHDEKFEQFQHNQGGNYESAYSQKSNAKTNIRDG